MKNETKLKIINALFPDFLYEKKYMFNLLQILSIIFISCSMAVICYILYWHFSGYYMIKFELMESFGLKNNMTMDISEFKQIAIKLNKSIGEIKNV